MSTKNKKAADWLRQAGYLDTDDLQTIDYNNDTSVNDLDDLQTKDYNNDTHKNKIIQNSTLNMNLMKSVKYGLSPEEIEK